MPWGATCSENLIHEYEGALDKLGGGTWGVSELNTLLSLITPSFDLHPTQPDSEVLSQPGCLRNTKDFFFFFCCQLWAPPWALGVPTGLHTYFLRQALFSWCLLRPGL